jgi:hypothetical protein
MWATSSVTGTGRKELLAYMSRLRQVVETALKEERSRVDGRMSFAVDITPDRRMAAIAVAGPRDDGRVHVEVVDHRPGTSWVGDRLVDLAERWGRQPVTIDPGSPAGSLVVTVRERGIEVREVSARQVVQATGQFYDLVMSGGLRHTWGNFALDVGGVYYVYPGGSGTNNIDPTIANKNSTKYNYWEIYAKPSYQIAPWLNVGLNLYWTSNFAATSTDGTALSATAKVPLPAFGPGGDFGWYVSGEFGHQWLSSSAYNYDVTNVFTGATYNTTIAGYNWWNAGIAFTYKAATLDLRYSGTDLSNNDCAFMISNQNACGNKFVASLSFATSFNALK